MLVFSILVLTGLTFYSIVHNYISKINIIDNDLSQYDSNLSDQALISTYNAASKEDKDLTDHDGVNDAYIEEKKETSDYEDYYSFIEQLNMPVIINNDKPMESDSERSSQLEEKSDESAKSSNNTEKEIFNTDIQVELSEDLKQYIQTINNIEPKIDDKVTNLLLIGRDLAGNDNSYIHSFALFTINKRSKKLIATSFSNNMYLYIPGIGMERLLTAYNVGGANLIIKTLEKNFGLQIDGYIMADYSAYICIVDTIGGVELTISNEELAPVNRNIREINAQLGLKTDEDLLDDKGLTLLNGKQALGYSRNWYDEAGEFISSGNQKAVILSILNKVKNFNIIEMNGFLNELLPKITTNLSESKIIEIIVMLPIYFGYGIDYLSLPVKGSERKLKIDGNTVIIYNSGQNLSQLYSRLYAKQ